jgi:hypothetical protein
MGSYPKPFVDFNNNSVNVLNVSSSQNLLNSIYIYDNTLDPDNYDDNKAKILSILNSFRDNTLPSILNDGGNESYYDINTIIINKITNASGIYYNTLKYGDLFNLINNSIGNYFKIYLKNI